MCCIHIFFCGNVLTWKHFRWHSFGEVQGVEGESSSLKKCENTRKKFEKWGEKNYVKLCETKSEPIKMWSFNFSKKNDGQFLNCDNTYDTLVFIAKLIFLQRRFSCQCETYADKHGWWLPASLKIKRDVKGREMLGEPEIWVAVFCWLYVCLSESLWMCAIGKTKC